MLLIFRKKNLVPKVTEPTRICSTSVSHTSTIIDHVWDSFNSPTKSIVISYPVSDHFAILSLVSIPNNNRKTVLKRTINVNRKRDYIARFDAFLDNFFRNGSFADPEFAISTLLTHLSENINSSFPVRSRTVKAISIRSPWITRQLIPLIHKKHLIFRKCKLKQLPFSKFRAYRNLLTKTLNLAKKIYFHKLFLEAKGDQKSTWNLINKCLKKKDKFDAPPEIRLGHEIHTNDDEIANLFMHKFFPENSTPPNNSNASTTDRSFDPPLNSRSAFFTPITTSEIISVISSLNKDSIHTAEYPVELIQLIAPKIALFLTRAFNSCLNLGIFPECLKSSIIKPRFKKGSKFSLDNYRPISNINVFSKIFEKLIYSRLISFIESQQLLSETQFGFLRNKGIEKAALTFLYDVYSAKNHSLSTAAVYIDYSRAFDTIDHNILLYKLHCLGIRGHLLNLFESFLSSRRYRVRIRSSLSDPVISTVGTPQGSSLSPLLFIIDINDVVSHMGKCKVLLYADDIVLYHSKSDSALLQSEIQADINKIYSFSTANKLLANTLKTKFMLFKASSNSPDIKLNLNNEDIECVKEFKYLGLTIDNQLSFKTHILNITKKLNSVNGAIYSLSFKVPSYILRKIFYSIGHPHLNLHIIAWGGASLSSLYPLNIALNKIVRNIKSNSVHYNLNTNDSYNALNILQVSKLYKLRLSEFIYCSLHNNRYITQDFLVEHGWQHEYNTRRVSPFILPRSRTVGAQTFFVFKAFKLWPSIPQNVKDSPSSRSFKINMKSYLGND